MTSEEIKAELISKLSEIENSLGENQFIRITMNVEVARFKEPYNPPCPMKTFFGRLDPHKLFEEEPTVKQFNLK